MVTALCGGGPVTEMQCSGSDGRPAASAEQPDTTAAPPQAAVSPTGCSPLHAAITRARHAWEASEPQLFIEV